MKMSKKTSPGRFFEDFVVGQTIVHATPRTITSGDRALVMALYPIRHALYSSDEFARNCGLREAPLEDFAVFHFVFGKTVPDISINAVANLGYAGMRFRRMVHVGDTISASSEVIGVKENSSGRTGIVWVRTTGINQHRTPIIEFIRWVMVAKRHPGQRSGVSQVPDIPASLAAGELETEPGLDYSRYRFDEAGEAHGRPSYEPGETIDHGLGVTVEEAEHMMATRLWQNPARVHFDAGWREDGRRLVYGGHVISMARALSFYGLANAQPILGVNSGSHVSPCFAGTTVHAWSRILDCSDSRAPGAAALRIRTIATNCHLPDFPEQADPAATLLDLDYWALVPAGNS